MLPCRHWIAESPEGVAIQVYTLMIASLLLMLWTGRRPSKRQMEALRRYWMGFISEQDLTGALGLQKKRARLAKRASVFSCAAQCFN
jgi:hypothetical protein